MALISKDFTSIVEDVLQSVIDANVGLSNVNAGSVLRTLIEALAENEDMMNYYLNSVYDNMDINNCTGDELDRSATILGLTRYPADSAVGELTLYTGSEPAEYDISIPSGFIVSTRPDNTGAVREFYITDTNAVLHAGESSVNVTIKCTESGSVFIPAGSITTMSRSLIGIQSVTNLGTINGGSNKESDEDFRKRIKAVKETFGKCTDEALQTAVAEVDGVASCVVADRMNGNGTTGVIVVADTMPPPTSVQTAVATAVSKTKASGIEAVIVYADVVYVDISITVDSDENTKILGIINDYCNSLNAGQSFVIKQMERKILNGIDNTDANNDEVDITTLTPTSNVSVLTTQIIRAGDVTINGVKVQDV